MHFFSKSVKKLQSTLLIQSKIVLEPKKTMVCLSYVSSFKYEHLMLTKGTIETLTGARKNVLILSRS